MLSLFTILLTLLASGPAYAASVEESATLLSRFPLGLMPASIPVLDAVGTIGDEGSESHLALLESLIEEEDRTIREAAIQAARAITGRKQLSIRHHFTPPTHQDLRRWVAQHPHEFIDRNGRAYGKTESIAVAYARIVLGNTNTMTSTKGWESAGKQLELHGETQQALRLYTKVASSGNTSAMDEIKAFGLNPELLILGMFSTQAGSNPDENATLDVMIHSGSLLTVRFLTERSCSPDPMGRAIALDALSQMIAQGTLTRGASDVAHRSLVIATKDPSSNVRTLAQAALSELAAD
ncbi:MAG: hypothetical protein CL930_06350 [Deltaproteobacteria bacterium]|nr:hypothetical protein [Deltaproteobacteria bacterium]